jgi:hypothetical protein
MDERRRQKKLARKAAKRKKSLAAKRTFHGGGSTGTFEKQVAFAAGMPLHECLVPRGLFDMGIGNLVISRKMPNDHIGFAIFLVDVFCLGVKNCLFAVLPLSEYERKMRDLRQAEVLESIQPACAVKLIENAVAYAQDLGIRPHWEYAIIKRIFGDINPAICGQEFRFGKDGKPLYISGPHETKADSERIIDILNKKLGPGEFDFMMKVDLQDERFLAARA